MRLINITKIALLAFSLVITGCKKEEHETCTDGIKNQTETDVDCGGTCTACPTCTDGIKNQDETGVDCGGSCKSCETCTDGIKNQTETGVDCGGPCAACPTPSFKATLGGTLLTATTISSLIDNSTMYRLVGSQGNKVVQLVVKALPSTFTTKTYDLSNIYTFYNKNATINSTDSICNNNLVGTITFSKVDKTHKLLSGTFSFTCKFGDGTSGSATNGSFTDVALPE